MKITSKYYISLSLSIIIFSPMIIASHTQETTDKYSIGLSIAQELEGVKESFAQDILLYREWTKKIQTLSETIDEHDALRVTIFACVKEKFIEINNTLNKVIQESEKDKKKSSLMIEQLEGKIIALERACKNELNDMQKKYDKNLAELKSAQDLLETLEAGNKERGEEIQKKIMETRQEYKKMVAERTVLFDMLTNFSNKLKAFNYTHHSGLQELSNNICNQIDKIKEHKTIQ